MNENYRLSLWTEWTGRMKIEGWIYEQDEFNLWTGWTGRMKIEGWVYEQDLIYGQDGQD